MLPFTTYTKNSLFVILKLVVNWRTLLRAQGREKGGSVMRALNQHMLPPCTSALKSGFYFTSSLLQPHTPHSLSLIPTCLFLESHWESLTKTGWSECESKPLALLPCSRAGHLTNSSRLGQVGPLDQTWETPAATTAKLLYSPSSFRLFSPLQVPTLLLSLIPEEQTEKSIQSTLSSFCVCEKEWNRNVEEPWWQNGACKRRCQRRFSPRRANFILLSG